MGRRNWIINAFLFFCPMAGIATFVNGFLSGAISLRVIFERPEIDQFFDLPSTTNAIVLSISILLALVVAKLSHRLLGFLSVASLLFILIACAGWIHSYRAYDWATFAWLNNSPPEPTVQSWWFDSTAGELLLGRRYVKGNAMLYESGYYHFSPARHRTIALFSGVAATRNMADTDRFAQTQGWLRRIGFGRTTNPPGMNPKLGGLTFAMAVPYWFVCLLAASFPLGWMIRYYRRRCISQRIKSGACPTCGYDLRATPEDQSRYPLNYEARIGAD